MTDNPIFFKKCTYLKQSCCFIKFTGAQNFLEFKRDRIVLLSKFKKPYTVPKSLSISPNLKLGVPLAPHKILVQPRSWNLWGLISILSRWGLVFLWRRLRSSTLPFLLSSAVKSVQSVNSSVPLALQPGW